MARIPREDLVSETQPGVYLCSMHTLPGQRKRVGIARALMKRPKLLLADEPTSSPDPKTSVEIMSLMRDQSAARGIPAIVNIHNVELAKIGRAHV
mgnify:CR=1 FL=1